MPNDLTTGQLVLTLQQEAQDFEFYPTTNEIIDALARDIQSIRDEHGYRYRGLDSVLDIGAGNGKVLLALRERAGMTALHAIEKSEILCDQLPPDILIVGTDFAQQSLLSKHTDVTFCNPPYSVFEEWAIKIIRQSASRIIYLVIPERWERSAGIADALKYRDAECAKVVLLFDVRAFKNRNLHIRFAKPFILALNVEHGRLKGWLHSREQAAEELQDNDAAEYFRANKLLTQSSILMLGAPQS